MKNALNRWRWSWGYTRRKEGIGPDDDAAWAEYVNSLTVAEVLEQLARSETGLD